VIDTSPGSPDGPPIEERTSAAEYVGRGIALAALFIIVAFMLTGMVWGTAWMLTHFPH
jgi:hypothetical protein